MLKKLHIRILLILFLWIPLLGYTQKVDKEVLINLLLKDRAEKDSLLAEADLLIDKQSKLIFYLDSLNKIKADRITNLQKTNTTIANLLSVSNTSNEILQEAYNKASAKLVQVTDELNKKETKITNKNKLLKGLGITSGISVPLLILLVTNAFK